MNTGRVGKAKPTKDPDITAAADRAEARSEENRRNAEARDGLVTGKPPNRFAPDVAMAPHAERGLDVYETPPVAVHALLKVESLVAGRIWEPACGPGAIVRVLRDRGHDVVASDIKDYGCPDSRGDVDFLKQAAAPDGATVILTNPPYRRSNRFVRLALKYAPLVIMLLPIRFLVGERRSDILEGGKLRCIYVFRNRLPMMHRHGWRGAKIDKGKAAYAWFVWDAGHSGPATIHHISWEAADAERATPADDGAIPEFLRRTEAERS
jgi:hypothetical protein